MPRSFPTWSASLRVAGLAILVSAGFIGRVALASSTVGDTNAGVVRVAVSVPTEITPASDAKVNVAQLPDYLHFINVSATLANDGSPLAGEQVEFTAGGGVICQATTDASGTAACPSDTKRPASDFSGTPGFFVASFKGDGGFAAATSDPPGELKAEGH